MTDLAAGTIKVPKVVGLSLAEARSKLADAKLGIVPVFLAASRASRGRVFDSQPAAGAKVNGTTSVEVDVSAGPDPAGGIVWAAHVFQGHPRVFVGNYRGPDSNAVVAIGANADPARWRRKLRAQAAGRPFTLVRCDKTVAELESIRRSVGRLIQGRDFKGVASWWTDPRVCSVVVEGLLPVPSIEQLHATDGSGVTVIDGVPPPSTL